MSAAEVQVRSRSGSACPVCDALPSVQVAEAGLERCVHCGHVWRVGGPDNHVFESEDYVEWRSTSAVQRRRQDRIAGARLAWIEDLLPSPGRSLEIGCSTGEVVQALASRSWLAYGLDLSRPAILRGTRHHPLAQLGVGVKPEDADFPADGYDLICAFHVVEHLAHLNEFADLVSRALRPGGLLYLRVPNWDSWSRRVMGTRWPSLVPEHLHQFTPNSMMTWVERQGLVVVRLGTFGDAREWAGGVRRILMPADRAASRCAPMSPRALRLLDVLQGAGWPWFQFESLVGKGSELLVVARRPATA